MNITIPLFLSSLLCTSALRAQSNTSPLMMFGETDPIKKSDAAAQEEQARQQEASRPNQGQFQLDSSALAGRSDTMNDDDDWKDVSSRSPSPVAAHLNFENMTELGGVSHEYLRAWVLAGTENRAADQDQIFEEILDVINRGRQEVGWNNLDREALDRLKGELALRAAQAHEEIAPLFSSISSTSSSTKAAPISQLKHGGDAPSENREDPRFTTMRETFGIPREQVKAWILAGEEDASTGGATQAAAFKNIISDSNAHRAELGLPQLSEKRQQLLADQLTLRAREARGENISEAELFSESDFVARMLYPPVTKKNEEVSAWKILNHFCSQNPWADDNSLGTDAGYNRFLNRNEIKSKIWYLNNLIGPAYLKSCVYQAGREGLHYSALSLIIGPRYVQQELEWFNIPRITVLNKSLKCLEKQARMLPSQYQMSEQARSHYLHAAAQYQMEELYVARELNYRNDSLYQVDNPDIGYRSDYKEKEILSFNGASYRCRDTTFYIPSFIAKIMAQNTEQIANCELGISSSQNAQQISLLQDALRYYQNALSYRAELLFDQHFWNQAAERASYIATYIKLAADATFEAVQATAAGNQSEATRLTLSIQQLKNAAEVGQAFLQAKFELGPKNNLSSRVTTAEETRRYKALEQRDANFFTSEYTLLQRCKNRTNDLVERTNQNPTRLDIPLKLLQDSDHEAAECLKKSAFHLKESIDCFNASVIAREDNADEATITAWIELSDRYSNLADDFLNSAERFSRDYSDAFPRRDDWTETDTQQLQRNFDEATIIMAAAVAEATNLNDTPRLYNDGVGLK